MKAEGIPPGQNGKIPPPAQHHTAGGCPIPIEERQLFEHSLALLLITVALGICCVFALKAIILGKTALFYRYWHCLPCLLFAFGGWIIPAKDTVFSPLPLRYTALTLLAFTPFPTWALLSRGNGYLELCACICLLASITCLQALCRYIKALAFSTDVPWLQQQAKKTQWLLLYLVLVPLCALYLAEVITLPARNLGAWRSIFQIWGYGQISLYLRILLYWGLLQSTTLALLTFLLVSKRLRIFLLNASPAKN